VPDLDTALDWAARYPAGSRTVVEVRPEHFSPGRLNERKIAQALLLST
jgi:hypothetical protein